jgi:hypothetical protein
MEDMTIQELEEQYKALGEHIKQKKKEEEEKVKAQLALEQERRKKEVDDAFKVYDEARKKFNALANAYTSDFGYYRTPAIENDTMDIFDVLGHKAWNHIF